MRDHETPAYWKKKYDRVIANFRRKENELAQVKRNERRLLQLLDVMEREMKSYQTRWRNLRRRFHHLLNKESTTITTPKEQDHGKERS